MSQTTVCTHCQEICPDHHPTYGDHAFCCHGCKSVYLLLNQHDLLDFYQLTDNPGLSQRRKINKDYAFLRLAEIRQHFIVSEIGSHIRVKLDLPQIHCASCIYLLEKLYLIHDGILRSTINFTQKKATILFDENLISFQQLVEILDALGYAPSFSYDNVEKNVNTKQDKKILYKIGVAGFSFGNIMLLSFPEYLGLQSDAFALWMSTLNILLALPVLCYAARDYFVSAYSSLKFGRVNVDVPIVIGMLALFMRSVVDIALGWGEGYLDSFTGFVFFLLIGKWFQNYTYQRVDFDNDFKNYFPISVLRKVSEKWEHVPIQNIDVGDVVLVKPNDIIPGDGLLLSRQAAIDYSFATGESKWQNIAQHDKVYAGGRIKSQAVEIQIEAPIDSAYFTGLWREHDFKKPNFEYVSAFINKASQYFTIAIVGIAILSLLYWLRIDPKIAFESFTATLIVACPCVLALAIPFLFGNAIRLLSQSKIYVKSAEALASLQKVDTIFFDKTGTLTSKQTKSITYDGVPLSDHESRLVKSAAFQSAHPLSQSIYHSMKDPLLAVQSFDEYNGQGIAATVAGHEVALGSSDFIKSEKSITDETTAVHLKIDNAYKGSYSFSFSVRAGTENLIRVLRNKKYKLGIISGDTSSGWQSLVKMFPDQSLIRFNQMPIDKLKVIQQHQSQGEHVLMIGDGLNDAGAFNSAAVGMAIVEGNTVFSPASDVIIHAEKWSEIPSLLQYARYIHKSLYVVLAMAILYNLIALCFAISGLLSPIVAAILMPTSSISMFFLGMGLSYVLHRRFFRRE